MAVLLFSFGIRGVLHEQVEEESIESRRKESRDMVLKIYLLRYEKCELHEVLVRNGFVNVGNAL